MTEETRELGEARTCATLFSRAEKQGTPSYVDHATTARSQSRLLR